MDSSSTLSLLACSTWRDYELLDSGDGRKLERFGSYVLDRPEVQCMWNKALPEKEWARVYARFQPTDEESGGHWIFSAKSDEKWKMSYDLQFESSDRGLFEAHADASKLRFWAMTTAGRHVGVFPEAASHWDLLAERVRVASDRAESAGTGVRVLNLFGYTGLATLAAAAAGARVTHVDASRKAVAWARENQALSNLSDRPIRWIVDDALKFVEREARRGARYDGIILDPPKFGRGPKGEVWEVYKSLPRLLRACSTILSDNPLFMILTVYAVKTSAVHIGQAIQEVVSGFQGSLQAGELVTREKSEGRLLSQAVFARWISK